MSLLVRFTIIILFLLTLLPARAFDQYETFTEKGKVGLINKDTEEIVLEAEYEAVGWSGKAFSIYEKTVGVKRNGKWALATLEGKLVTQPLYTVLYPFVQGLLIAGERSRFSILNQYGVINTKGRVIIELDKDQLSPNQNQLIAGKLSHGQYRYGLLSSTGKEIIPIDFQAITPVVKSLYSVKGTDDLSALYDKDGRQLSAFEFEHIEAFDDQRLLIKYYNRKGLVDHSGSVIIPPIYKDIQIENGKVRALPFKKWRLWSGQGEDRDFFFDKMLPLDEDHFAVQSNENLGIIDRKEAYIAYFSNLKMLRSAHGLLIAGNGIYEGVIGPSGKILLPINYDEIKVLEEVIFARINRKDGQNWEVFDRQGKLISRQRYESFQALESGTIKASRNGKLGILSAKGREQSPFVYDSLGLFQKGLAVVKYLGNVGMIRENGNWLITPYKDALVLYDEFILYKQGSESGLLNFDEKVVFRTQAQLTPVNKDLVISHTDDGYLALNGQGEPLLEDAYDSIVVVHNDLLGLIDGGSPKLFRPSKGRMIGLPEHTETIGSYSEDFVMAKIDGQWGFVREDGSLVVANRYEDVKPFSEGLASVKLIGKWGVINKQEQIIIQPTYDSIGAFYGGLALIQRGENLGLINREGTNVLDLQYQVLDIQRGHILLQSGGVWGLADARGNLVRTPQYDGIRPIQSGVFMVQKNGKSGVVTLKGEDLVPLTYETIIPFAGGYLAAEASSWVNPKFK